MQHLLILFQENPMLNTLLVAIVGSATILAVIGAAWAVATGRLNGPHDDRTDSW
jgi:hypothetical protein